MLTGLGFWNDWRVVGLLLLQFKSLIAPDSFFSSPLRIFMIIQIMEIHHDQPEYFFITIHNKMLYPTIPIWANSWGLTLACFIHSKAPKPKILNVHLSTKCSHKRSWNYHTTALLFFFQLIKSLTQQACHNNYLVGGYAVPEIIRINGINVILRAYFATDVMII